MFQSNPVPRFNPTVMGGERGNVAVQPHANFHETPVYVLTRRSWRSVLPGLFLYIFACTLAVPVSHRFPQTLLHFSFHFSGVQYDVAMPLVGLIVAVLLMRPLFLMYDSEHLITSHHVRSTLGRWSLRRVDIEVAYEDMKGVSINQSLLQRILRVGTLHVWTALNASPEISMRGIGDPKTIADIIRGQIDQNRMKRHQAVSEGELESALGS